MKIELLFLNCAEMYERQNIQLLYINNSYIFFLPVLFVVLLLFT